MSGAHPEPLLLKALELDRNRLLPKAAEEIEHFIDFGECGLAYDIFVFEMEEKKYSPSPEALDQIMQVAEALGVKYPHLSTDN